MKSMQIGISQIIMKSCNVSTTFNELEVSAASHSVPITFRHTGHILYKIFLKDILLENMLYFINCDLD